MTGTTDDLMERIVQAVPRLRAVLDELRAEDVGELLPTLFVEEVCAPLVDRTADGDQGALAELRAITDVLEAATGDDSGVERAADGLLVHVPPLSAPGDDVRQLLGPKLTARLDRMQGERIRSEELAFVERLVAAVPALGPLADENRDDDHGDVLPHVFLGDVTAREIDNHLGGDPGAAEEVQSVLDALEREYGRDEGVDNAIAASFLENLPDVGEPGADIVALLGPVLKAQLSRQRPPASDQ